MGSMGVMQSVDLSFGSSLTRVFLTSSVLQISPRLWQLKMGMVNSYLLETDDGLLLVDAGWPNKTEVIFKAVQESGHNPVEIRHLVLTHGHIDHAGSAAEVRRSTPVCLRR